MRFPTAKPIDQFPCFLGESIYAGLAYFVMFCLCNLREQLLSSPISGEPNCKCSPREMPPDHAFVLEMIQVVI